MSLPATLDGLAAAGLKRALRDLLARAGDTRPIFVDCARVRRCLGIGFAALAWCARASAAPQRPFELRGCAPAFRAQLQVLALHAAIPLAAYSAGPTPGLAASPRSERGVTLAFLLHLVEVVDMGLHAGRRARRVARRD